MDSFQTSSLSAHLDQYLVDVEKLVTESHVSLQDYARQQATNHNKAIMLLMGAGEYESDWAERPLDAFGKPIYSDTQNDQFTVFLDNLTDAAKVQWWQTMDPDQVEHRVTHIARLSPNHPVAIHWKVFRAKCYQAGSTLPSWPELESLDQYRSQA